MSRGRDVPLPSYSEIKIHADHDLTIRTYTKDVESQFRSAYKSQVVVNGTITSTFLVRRDVILRHSQFLTRKIHAFSYVSPTPTIDLEESNVQGLEVVLRAIHDNINDRCLDLSVDDMWKVIEANLRYLDQNHFLKLKDWFASWLKGLDKSLLQKEDYLKLAVPCRRFEHAIGLFKVTRYLAFNVPVKIDFIYPRLNGVGLRIEPRLEAGLNSARGSLETILLECVESIEKSIYESKCDDECKAMSLLAVKRGLDNCQMFPPRQKLHGKRGISVQSALNRLKHFKYKPAPRACGTCRRDFSHKLQQMLSDPRRMFEGLCLGCVVDPTDNRDDHGKNNKFWGDGCRKYGLRHKEPSWYFSWVASERKTDDAYSDNFEGYGNGGLGQTQLPAFSETVSSELQEIDILPNGDFYNVETNLTKSAGFNLGVEPPVTFAQSFGQVPQMTFQNGFEEPTNEFDVPEVRFGAGQIDMLDFETEQTTSVTGVVEDSTHHSQETFATQQDASTQDTDVSASNDLQSFESQNSHDTALSLADDLVDFIEQNGLQSIYGVYNTPQDIFTGHHQDEAMDTTSNYAVYGALDNIVDWNIHRDSNKRSRDGFEDEFQQEAKRARFA